MNDFDKQRLQAEAQSVDLPDVDPSELISDYIVKAIERAEELIEDSGWFIRFFGGTVLEIVQSALLDALQDVKNNE